MLSFNNIYSETQSQLGDTSADTLTVIKRAINQGQKKFAAMVRRDWYNNEKIFSLAEDQQYYQMPEDCTRMKGLTVTIGSTAYPLVEIADEERWRVLNTTTTTADRPRFFFVRGSDEFGIWPTPASNLENAGRIIYQRKIRDMSQADYATGTVTVSNASAAVVGSGTTFTAQMVGRSLKVDDPDGDGFWYKIDSFTDATNITVENVYSGTTQAGRSYAIGELPDIPEEYHESLIDYALYRCYLRRRDLNVAADFKALFDSALEDCKTQYGSKTTSYYSRAQRFRYPSVFTEEPNEVT